MNNTQFLNKSLSSSSNLVAPLILAGGLGSRIGFYKPLLKIKNKTLIEIVVEALKQIFQDVYIVVKNYDQAIKICSTLRFKDVNISILYDELNCHHPLAGIFTGVKKLHMYRYLFILSCDLPNLTSEFVQYMVNLLSKFNEVDVLIPRWRNGFLEPLVAIYNRERLYNVLSRLKVDELCKISIRDVIKLFKNIVFVNADELVQKFGDVFRNINYLTEAAK